MKKPMIGIITLALIHTAVSSYGADSVDRLTPEQLEAELMRIGPQIEPPAELKEEEGLETRILTAKEVEELLPYAQDSKLDLEELLSRIRTFPRSKQVTELRKGLAQVLRDSGNRQSELLMRYVLSRGLTVSQVVQDETGTAPRSMKEWQLKFLKFAAKSAIGYYETDTAYLEKVRSSIDGAQSGKSDGSATEAITPDYAGLGIFTAKNFWAYGHTLTVLSAQYRVYRIALGLLMWDLYRDETHRKSFAAPIIRLNRLLSVLPESAPINSREIRDQIQVMKQGAKFIFTHAEKIQAALHAKLVEEEASRKAALETAEAERVAREKKEQEVAARRKEAQAVLKSVDKDIKPVKAGFQKDAPDADPIYMELRERFASARYNLDKVPVGEWNCARYANNDVDSYKTKIDPAAYWTVVSQKKKGKAALEGSTKDGAYAVRALSPRVIVFEFHTSKPEDHQIALPGYSPITQKVGPASGYATCMWTGTLEEAAQQEAARKEAQEKAQAAAEAERQKKKGINTAGCEKIADGGQKANCFANASAGGKQTLEDTIRFAVKACQTGTSNDSVWACYAGVTATQEELHWLRSGCLSVERSDSRVNCFYYGLNSKLEKKDIHLIAADACGKTKSLEDGSACYANLTQNIEPMVRAGCLATADLTSRWNCFDRGLHAVGEGKKKQTIIMRACGGGLQNWEDVSQCFNVMTGTSEDYSLIRSGCLAAGDHESRGKCFVEALK